MLSAETTDIEKSTAFYCPHCMKKLESVGSTCSGCGKASMDYRPSNHHIPANTVLKDRYVVGKCLGEGGFGITYIGLDINLELRVAIKEYFPSGLVNRNHTASTEVAAHYGDAGSLFEKGKKSFLGEARTLAKFSNESSIVSVRDFFSENNTAYIVMDYLEGTDLRSYLTQNGVMNFHQAFSMLSPVMEALSKVHAQGLIHRDISPANIMVTTDGTVKLLDFGAARDVGGVNEKSLSIMLKVGYAPEEQYRTKGDQGPWTDVYALSATIYKLVTGVTPEDAMNRIFQPELQAPSLLNDKISLEQDRVILKGLAVHREDRYQSMAELQRACRDALALQQGEAAYLADPDPERTVMEVMLGDEEERDVPTPVRAAGSASVQPAEAPTPIGSIAGQIPSQPIDDQPKDDGGALQKSVGEEPAQPSETTGGRKNPSKIFLILSTITGFISLYFFTGLIASIVSPDAEASTNVIGVICFALFVGATVLLGRRYYPLVNNRERKPRVLCLVASEIALVSAFLWMLMTYVTLADSSTEEGTGGDAAAFLLSLLVVAAFFGYFYYPRLSKKALRKATKIHGGILGAFVVIFVGYIVFISLNTITVGDTKIGRGETTVRLSFDIITDRDLAKLKELKKLESLEIYGCFLDDEDVKVIGELTWLRKLSLSANTDITDVSPLNHLKDLTYLDLSNTKTGDIACLADLTKLQTLKLNGTKVGDLSILRTYTSLDTLEMNSLSELDAATITVSPTLRVLECSNDDLESIDFLSGAESLQTLYAVGNHISDLAPLAKLDKLYSVDLSGNDISDLSSVCKDGVNTLKFNNNAISNLSPLTGIRVSILELSGNQISDISALIDNSKLHTLDLSHNNITDISSLRDCFNIFSLDLSYNSIVDITAIATIDDVKILNLRGNRIVDISPLAEAKSLVNATSLDLRDNQIESVQALSVFTKLDHLYLSNNHISDISPLAACSALVFLKLNKNQVSDITPLTELGELHFLEAVDNPITDLSSISLKPDDGAFEGTVLGNGVLHITYDDAIDWEALSSMEALTVHIYGTTDRQKAYLQDLGFKWFHTTNDLDTEETLTETEEQDG